MTRFFVSFLYLWVVNTEKKIRFVSFFFSVGVFIYLLFLRVPPFLLCLPRLDVGLDLGLDLGLVLRLCIGLIDG